MKGGGEQNSFYLVLAAPDRRVCVWLNEFDSHIFWKLFFPPTTFTVFDYFISGYRCKILNQILNSKMIEKERRGKVEWSEEKSRAVCLRFCLSKKSFFPPFRFI